MACATAVALAVPEPPLPEKSIMMFQYYDHMLIHPLSSCLGPGKGPIQSIQLAAHLELRRLPGRWHMQLLWPEEVHMAVRAN